jgi:flagellar basal-body rod modification protein FlgD
MSSINTDPTKILTLDEMKPQGSTTASLGKDQFLKLFVAQLQHQDPMNPMADGDMMGQMASFSTLEQITNLATASDRSATIGLIGRTVTYVDKDKVSHTGTVEKVTTRDGKQYLTVDGTESVDPATITQVA